jgi:hypothetical protein
MTKKEEIKKAVCAAQKKQSTSNPILAMSMMEDKRGKVIQFSRFSDSGIEGWEGEDNEVTTFEYEKIKELRFLSLRRLIGLVNQIARSCVP